MKQAIRKLQIEIIELSTAIGQMNANATQETQMTCDIATQVFTKTLISLKKSLTEMQQK